MSRAGLQEGTLRYGVSARSYLERCAKCLREPDLAFLFYAALELRNCVEARQAEYLEHYDPLRNTKVRPYRIGENAKKLTAIHNGEAIGRFEFILTSEIRLVEYYTPVPNRLKKLCEKSIDLLRHAQVRFRDANAPWWGDQRALLLEGYRLAWLACKGNIPMPPLWNQKTGETHPVVFDQTPENTGLLRLMSENIGREFSLQVSYLDAPPRHWVPDL